MVKKVIRKRNISLSFRVNEQERDIIKENMKRAGITNMREYLLQTAIGGYVIDTNCFDIFGLNLILGLALKDLKRRTANDGKEIIEDVEELIKHHDSATRILKKYTDDMLS